MIEPALSTETANEGRTAASLLFSKLKLSFKVLKNV
jgi:hypothetical protein